MKHFVSLLLTALILTSILPLSVISAHASPFAGGNGSEANPYLVGTPEALDAVRNNPSAHYRQVADIDMSAWGNWEGPDIYGSYNGNGFSISNLKITHDDPSRKGGWFGLFESVYHGTVKNVNLINIDYSINTIVENYDYMSIEIGGIAACSDNGIIQNCNVSGTIKASGAFFYNIGGILGSSRGDVLIDNCANSASIEVKTDYLEENSHVTVSCGGIAGEIDGRDKIERCTNIGNLNICSDNNAYVGGIIGKALYSADIINCLNSGNIFACITLNATNEPQGALYECICGGILADGNSIIDTCINYGSIDAITYNTKLSAISCGGISSGNGFYISDATIKNCVNAAFHINIASADGNEQHTLSKVSRITPIAGTIESCYSYDQTKINNQTVPDSKPTSTNGKNLKKSDLLIESSYPNFDFINTWIIDERVGGAILREIPFVFEPIEPLPIIPEIPSESTFADFNELLYRADHLTNGNSNILSDIATYNLLLTSQYSPSRIIVDSHPENMQTMAAAWEAIKATVEAADGDASQVMKQSAKQEDLITAYILGAVGVYTEYQYVDAVEKNFKHTQNLVTVLCELNGTYAAAGDEFKKFITDKDDDIEKCLLEYYDKTDPTMSALLEKKEGMSVIGSVISRANSIEDIISEISAYSKLYSVSESTKEALLLMYEVCPDEAKELKESLKLTAEIVSSANEEMIKDIAEREFAFGLCKEASYAITDKLWEYMTDAFVDKCAVAKGFVALAKMELTVMDKFFGIDARTEQYFKLCTLNEVDSVAGLAVHQALNNYNESPTSENAATFLAAIELKFGFVAQSYSESIKYSEIITDSGMLQKIQNGVREFLNIDNTNVLKDSLISAQKAKDALHCSLLTSWISSLDAEDHNLAENYYEYRERMYTRYQPELAEYFAPSRICATKQYSVHCPVNVSVYDSFGNLVAEVGEDAVWSSAEIAVVYDHEEKEIYFFGDTDYTIVCKGFDAGDMDIAVTDYDTDGNIIRTVNYNNVPVSPGSVHSLSSDSVSDSDGNTLECDYDSKNTDAKKYKISISYGVISGYLFETYAASGERIEISAIIPEGYRFVGWQAVGGEVVFEDTTAASTIFFMPEGEVAISAKLKRIDNDEDDDGDEKVNNGTSVIVIIVIAVAAVIILASITILIVMINEKKKNSKKE